MFKIRIRKGLSYYHLDWAYYRLFPDWKSVKIYRRCINEVIGYCGSLEAAKTLAISLDSYSKLKDWNNSQIELYQGVKDKESKELLPKHVVKGY